jgi:hypothetical protein
MERKHTDPSRPSGSLPDPYRVGRSDRASSSRQGGSGVRQALRRHTPLTALINFGMHYSRRWPLRDLSPEGAFVEMPAPGIKPGMSIEFVLRFRAATRVVEHRLPAQVERVAPDGVALRFGGYDDQAYSDLVHLLYAS